MIRQLIFYPSLLFSASSGLVHKCDFNWGIPCRKCGDDLDEDSVVKFNTLKLDFNNVLPCCSSASCAKGPQDGWKSSGKTKRHIRSRKRKQVVLDIDLKTFKPDFGKVY